ncbi:MAG: Crp/Fnr family transcriptional regulator, partial [Chloroflexota bacterium]
CAILQPVQPRDMREDRVESVATWLAQHPYFRDLAAHEREEIARQALVRHVERGALLGLEGEPCTAVYLVREGTLRALKLSAEGREQVVATLAPGQAIYVPPALDGQPLPVSTQAITAATLVSFARADWLQILRRHPSVALCVLAEFAQRLRQLTSLVEDLSLRSVPERLARLLWQQAQAAMAGAPPARMTQREMAARLGTVREVVARTLAQFERQGWIHVERGVIEILDLDALRRLAP